MHITTQRNGRSSAGIGVICGKLLLFLGVFGPATLCCEAAQPAQWVKWEIEATVTSIVDPGGYFPDVRLGDPVRGTLKYDLTLWPNPFYAGEHYDEYTNDAWAETASMVIENPRTSSEMQFFKDVNGEFASVFVYNDQPDDGGDFDAIYAVQSVFSPAGFVGGAPVVAVQLLGPTSNLLDRSLPSQFDLDDWPLSAITFYDAYFEDEFATSIEAEIYSLTPVIIPVGDFDFDGDVDGDDLQVWVGEYGSSDILNADADGDRDVDGADFLVWQRGFGNTTITTVVAVPEPATLALLVALVLASSLIARGRCLI